MSLNILDHGFNPSPLRGGGCETKDGKTFQLYNLNSQITSESCYLTLFSSKEMQT